MKSKKFRVQRDSVKAINVSMALFVKLLTKSCELMHSNNVTDYPTRMRNTLDVGDLAKAVSRYDVLGFLEDLVEEMDLASVSHVPDKRRNDHIEMADSPDSDVGDSPIDSVPEAKKQKVIPQGSILSFFNKAPVNANSE
jgi:hypothetical protein